MPELTRRQKQVMDALIKGYSNAQIAHEIGIDPHTVDQHLSNVFSKWNLPNRNRVGAAILHYTEQIRSMVRAQPKEE
jgi:DNA-binding NarL/FixJ family response regulator